MAILLLPLQQAVSGQLEDAFIAYKQGDFELAQKDWLALAIKGDVRAQFFLSVLLDKQSEGRKDRENSKRWLTAAANNGFVPAQFNIGNNFHKGKYGLINNKMAEYWWNQAAMQGFPDAQYHLATLYYAGTHGVERNNKEAFYWFEQAAKSGYKGAADMVLLMRAGEKLPLQKAGEPNNIVYDDPRIVSKLSLSPKQVAQAKRQKGLQPTLSQTSEVEVPTSAIAATKEKVDRASEEIVSKTGVSPPEQEKRDWISQQPQTNYTIQLMASTIVRLCNNHRNKLSATAGLETHIQPFMKKGKRYCAVVFGSFGSYSRAKAGLKKLPRNIRKSKPWIRKIAR